MKYILLLSLFLPFTGHTQSDTVLSYTGIVHADSSVKADELYNRARLWLAENFKDSKSVIEIADKQTGELVGKGAIKYDPKVFIGWTSTVGWVTYNLKIYVKDGRYKYTFTNFIHTGSPPSMGQQQNFDIITSSDECPPANCKSGMSDWCTRVWKDIKKQIATSVDPLIPSLQKAMQAPSATKQDW